MSKPAAQPGVVIVDMDGTIADATRREREFLLQPVKDWPGFFRDMENDPPIQSVLDHVHKLAKTHDIVILTGRPERYRHETESWLERHNIRPAMLLMRPHGDSRPDYIAKPELLRRLAGRDLVLALDDRGPVCDEYRKRGIRVMQITSNFENEIVNQEYQKHSE